VVDSGLARRPRYDRAAGMTRLVTERASQAAATQRSGRAARQAAGVAYRLWEEAATAGMPRFDPAEILEADLCALTLDCALWGVSDPRTLKWVDPPPEAALVEARARLVRLGALGDDGRPTAHGKAMAELPLPPRLAHMLIAAAECGIGEIAAKVAVLLSERGLGGNDVDLEVRLERWQRERGKRAEAARGLARRWLNLVKATRASGGERGLAAAIALAFPDRLARRRSASGEHWASVGGRGFRLDPASPLAKSDWLAVAETQGAASGARIVSAAHIEWREIEMLYADRIEVRRTLTFDPDSAAVEAKIERRIGAITIASGYDAHADPRAVAQALVDGVRCHGLAGLDWSEAAQALRTRAAYAGQQALSDAALLDNLDQWLPALVAGKRKLSDIAPDALYQAVENQLGWDSKRALDALAPAEFLSPAGTSHAIDYSADGGPQVTLRVQALFGLAAHPTVGRNQIPLVLSLTSPAGRPIQTTRDLPGFWAGSWADVVKDMRGAYPKHNWPDDPTKAIASLKTKKAQSRS
jgi:ATP-dependent helicase HrpB